MRTVSSNTIGDYIVDQIDGAISSPIIKTEYYSDTQSTWKTIASEFIENRTINSSSQNDRYQVQSFVPPVKTLDLILNNFDQGWNDDGARAGIIAKNRLIRCWSGLNMPVGTDTTLTDDFATDTKFVETVKSGSTVIAQYSGYSGTISTASEFGYSTYGSSATYGSALYGQLGYYQKMFTIPEAEENEASHIKLNVSSNKFSFKYRVGSDSAFIGSTWYEYRALASGVNSLGLTADNNQNFVQYIVRFDGNTYGADILNSAELHYKDRSELFKQGTFILDQPKFNEKVNCQGRDYLRKALETEINMPSVTNEGMFISVSSAFRK